MGKDKRQSPSTLLWFIRHKSYVPISEIRRRFFIESDEGSFIDTGNHHRVFVGLPSGTAQSIEKLWKQGKIGLELSVEFDARVLIGVYPMNPSKEHLNGSPNGSHRMFPREMNGNPELPVTDVEALDEPGSVGDGTLQEAPQPFSDGTLQEAPQPFSDATLREAPHSVS